MKIRLNAACVDVDMNVNTAEAVKMFRDGRGEFARAVRPKLPQVAHSVNRLYQTALEAAGGDPMEIDWIALLDMVVDMLAQLFPQYATLIATLWQFLKPILEQLFK